MRLTFSIELTRDKDEPLPEREVDMGSQVELGPQPAGFAAPMHYPEEDPYEDRRKRNGR